MQSGWRYQVCLGVCVCVVVCACVRAASAPMTSPEFKAGRASPRAWRGEQSRGEEAAAAGWLLHSLNSTNYLSFWLRIKMAVLEARWSRWKPPEITRTPSERWVVVIYSVDRCPCSGPITIISILITIITHHHHRLSGGVFCDLLLVLLIKPRGTCMSVFKFIYYLMRAAAAVSWGDK